MLKLLLSILLSLLAPTQMGNPFGQNLKPLISYVENNCICDFIV